MKQFSIPILLFILALAFVACKKETTQLAPITVYPKAINYLVNNKVSSITIDSFNNIWVMADLLYKYDGKDWTSYKFSSNINYNETYCLAIDKNNNKWLSTDHGLIKFDGTTWTQFATIYTKLIVIDKQNNIWFDSNKYLQNDLLHIINDTINSFYFNIDSKNNRWYTSVNSPILYKSDGTTISTFNYKSFCITYISGSNAISIDKNDNIWVGTDGSGVLKFDGNSWIQYSTYNSSLICDNINCIFFDKKGNVWIGTYYGISKFDGKNWYSYDLRNNGIGNPRGTMQIICDKNNNIWCAGTYGLYEILAQ